MVYDIEYYRRTAIKSRVLINTKKKTSQGMIEAKIKKINYAVPSGYIALIDSAEE
jgi:hypothetical protein